MPAPQTLALSALFIPMAAMITYMDVKYRRIPNKLVLTTLLGGIFLNTYYEGTHGLVLSLGGFAVAFGVTIFLHTFGTMGAGDVKLFGAIGAVSGVSLVIPTLLLVAITGGLLAIAKMIYSGRARTTMFGVLQFFYGLLPGQRVPRFAIPDDRNHTLPYAVPICFGSVLAFLLFHA